MSGLFAFHLSAALDELLPGVSQRHTGPEWALHNAMMPSLAWGLLHIALCLMLLVGVYRPTPAFTLVRVANALSVSVIFALGLSYGIGVVTHYPRIPLVYLGWTGFALAVAIAGLLEPTTNPASASTG